MKIAQARVLQSGQLSGQQSELRPSLGADRTRLSFAEERMWFLDRLARDDNAGLYNVTAAHDVEGPLQATVLEDALAVVVARHETLRSVYPGPLGEPVRVVRPAVEVRLEIVDLEALANPALREGAIAERVEREARTRFNLERGPLFRLTLLRSAPAAHTLIAVLHHIVSDEGSLALFFAEVAEAYDAIIAGRTVDASAVAVQYADWALWQRERLTDARLDVELAYWCALFTPPPATLRLPFDYPPAPGARFPGATESITFPRPADRVGQSVTPFMTALAAWVALVHRITGQDDIVVGVPVSERDAPETERLIGLFLNTIFVRVGVSGDVSATELLARTRAQVVGALAHRIVPFERVVTALGWSGSVAPFQVMFVHDRVGAARVAFGGLTLTPRDSHSRTAKVPLSLYVAEHADRLEATVEYRSDAFSPHTVRALLGDYRALLELVRQGSDAPLSRARLSQALERAPASRSKVEKRVAGRPDWRSPTEELVSSIFAAVLRRDDIDPEDSFFDLGGHSLLALRILGRLDAVVGVAVPLGRFIAEPTVRGVARAVVELIADSPPDGGAPITASPRDGDPPLSFAQQRLWFLETLAASAAEGERSVYTIPIALALSGRLDVSALERALTGLVARHESLRTRFCAVDGVPVQRIDAPAALSLERFDVRHLHGPARSVAIAARLSAEAVCPFDLERGPLLRALLVSRDEEEHVLILTLHHIAADAWSLTILLRELFELYRAEREDRPPSLPAPTLQYVDFALWQRRVLDGDHLRREVEHWRAVLADAPAFLALPPDRVRPPVASYCGASAEAALSPVLLDQLRALAGSEGATLFMALLAGFQLLLGRYTGHDDLVVGTPFAGRRRAEWENVIGFFVNTLPIRTRLGGDLTVRGLLVQVRDAVLAADAHQHLPFERLVEELRPARDPSRAPIFQAVFVVEEEILPAAPLPGLDVTPLDVETGVARYDLTLVVHLDPSQPQLVLEYNSDVLDEESAARLLEFYRTVLREMTIDATRPVARLPLFSPEERVALLAAGKARALATPETLPSVLPLFADVVARCGDGVALEWADGQRSWSYSQLAENAQGLARALTRLGVEPESRVGICLDRGPESVTAMLAIMMAGAAFVPLDPAHPTDRLAFMCEDAALALVVTDEPRATILPASLARISPSANGAGGPLPACLDSDRLAFVIYTSGSTGRPKAVLLTHGGVANLALAQRELFALSPHDRVLQFASPSFDASVWEIVFALTSGATLVLATPEELSPNTLAEVLIRRRITHATLTPSVLAVLEPEALPSLTAVISAGEACPAELARRWSRGRRFWNAYGPTEVTVCATSHAVDAPPASEGLTAPIGVALPNVAVYVLDRNLEPVPVGAVGELYVGGPGLARGYSGSPG